MVQEVYYQLYQSLEDLELNDPDEPTPPGPGNHIKLECWKVQYRQYDEKVQEYANCWLGLVILVYLQCTQAMREHLKSHQNFQVVGKDRIGLLVIIQSILHMFEEQQKISDDLNETKKLLQVISR